MKKVLVHGCFDVIHYGHLAHLKEAKAFGDHLTVSVTSDRYINKGPGRPYFSLPQRVAMLKSISLIDEVIISDHPTAVEVIRLVKPDFYVKGPDYKDLTKDVTGEIHNEKKEAEAHGGHLVFTEDITFSSSTLINKFLNSWSEEQKIAIELVKSKGGIDAIEKSLREMENLSVTIVGEPIIDVYRFVEPEGISSKSPTVSARFLFEERYNGGSLAIERSCQFFTKNPRLHTPPQNPIEKIRYLSGSTRIFECTKTPDNDYWVGKDQHAYLRQFAEMAQKSDVVIVADFGHGMFNEHFVNELTNVTKFVGLNVQTNSSNYGFNLFNKHRRFDYLCLDTREIRLAMHDKHSTPLSLARKIWVDSGRKDLSITLGSNGSNMFTNNKEIHSPAFSDGVIDPIGAGDAYFLITTLLLKTDCPIEIIPFVGNVYAGLKCKIIGNKESVSKANLLKACQSILK